METSNRQDLIDALHNAETRDAAMVEIYEVIKLGERLIKMKMYTKEQVKDLRRRFENFHEEIAKATNPAY